MEREINDKLVDSNPDYKEKVIEILEFFQEKYKAELKPNTMRYLMLTMNITLAIVLFIAIIGAFFADSFTKQEVGVMILIFIYVAMNIVGIIED